MPFLNKNEIMKIITELIDRILADTILVETTDVLSDDNHLQKEIRNKLSYSTKTIKIAGNTWKHRQL